MVEIFAIPDAYLGGLPLLCALCGLGLVIGVLTGLFGVGGAFLITPMLNVLFGIDYQIAVGSSLCFTIGAGANGLARHARLKNVEVKSMVILGGGGVCGAWLGAVLNGFLKSTFGAHDYTLVMHGLFILVLTLTAWLIFRGASAGKRRLSLLQRVRLPPYIDLPGAELSRVSLVGMCLAGLSIGVMKGLLGIGGGVLFMPVLILVVGLRPHQAVGTSLGVVLFSSISGTIKYGVAEKVYLSIALALLVGSTIGIQVGAWLCQKLPGTKLRRYFAALVLAVVAMLAVAMVEDLIR